MRFTITSSASPAGSARPRRRAPAASLRPSPTLATPLALMLVLGIGLGACGSGGDEVADPDEAVVLGAVYSLDGSQGDFDGPSAKAARLAVEARDAAGGVLARPVALALADAESQPIIAKGETQTLLLDHPEISAFFGLSDTDMVLAAAPVAAAAERLFLSSGATSPELPQQVPDWLFLACFGDNVQAAAAAEFAYETLDARSAAVLFNDSTTYTRLLRSYFETSFRSLGGQILSEQAYPEGGDLGDPIDALALEADVVFLSAQVPDEAVGVARALREAGFQGPIIGGDGFDAAAAWAAVPELSEIYYSSHAYLGADSEDPRIIAFREAYMTAYPGEEPNGYAALGYDTANLLMDAIARAGSTEPTAIRDALAATQGFQGVTGAISYPDGSRIPSKSVAIIAVSDGRLALAENRIPVSIPAP